MNKYLIYRNTFDNIIAVKEGFSWTGFVLVWFWTIYKKLYLITVILMVANYMILRITDTELAKYAFQFILMIVVGIKGNVFIRDSLIKNGYSFVTSLDAKNKNDALSKYRDSFSIADL